MIETAPLCHVSFADSCKRFRPNEMQNEPRDHHYAPQFYLKSFASDPAGRKINTLSKNGHVLVWAQRSIKSIGVERDLYIHTTNGTPVSVEAAIGGRIESPISGSETWRKIVSGNSSSIDKSDKLILYSMIRHLEARTPHYRETFAELVKMSYDPNSEVRLSEEERLIYRSIGKSQNMRDTILNKMAATLEWTEHNFKGAALQILRSQKPFRSSTTPVFALRIPNLPGIQLPYSNMTPFQLVLPLNPYTAAVLIMGDFDGAFENIEVPDLAVAGLNRHRAGWFCHFPKVNHLITGQDDLEADLKWANHELVHFGERTMKFRHVRHAL